MDNNASQDFTQELIYQGSRGPVDVRTMVVTYAVRAFDKLLREHGHSLLNTPLVGAIAKRAQLEGSIATGVDAVSGDKRMLRGTNGTFLGGYLPKERR
jgi:hypothetical protein